ncbi:MAG: pilus assembly protein [Rhizobiales bacterium]|nr:pilus assembly protein [Hyphomicrobiales bacterium]
MIRKLISFRRDTRGVAAIEMAFIMPFLLILFFGLVDLTQLISLNRKVTYTASVVGDLVTQNQDTVAAAAFTDYFDAAELVMKPADISGVRVEVYQFRDEGGSITSQWNRKSSGGSACWSPSSAGLSSLMTDGNDVVVTAVCTTYTPFMATFLGQAILGATSFTMSEQIALRPRQSATLDCTGCP